MATMRWQPAWWNEHHASAWERVKEAMRRDWEQTLHDLHVKGGHELNQDLGDTVKQAAGKEPLPPIDAPNPPRVIGDADWADVEVPCRYGYAARDRYGDAAWSRDLEEKLRTEWESGGGANNTRWDEVRGYVRRGWEYRR